MFLQYFLYIEGILYPNYKKNVLNIVLMKIPYKISLKAKKHKIRKVKNNINTKNTNVKKQKTFKKFNLKFKIKNKKKKMFQMWPYPSFDHIIQHFYRFFIKSCFNYIHNRIYKLPCDQKYIKSSI